MSQNQMLVVSVARTFEDGMTDDEILPHAQVAWACAVRRLPWALLLWALLIYLRYSCAADVGLDGVRLT